jgi:hypothetical protein
LYRDPSPETFWDQNPGSGQQGHDEWIAIELTGRNSPATQVSTPFAGASEGNTCPAGQERSLDFAARADSGARKSKNRTAGGNPAHIPARTKRVDSPADGRWAVDSPSVFVRAAVAAAVGRQNTAPVAWHSDRAHLAVEDGAIPHIARVRAVQEVLSELFLPS